MLIWHQFTLEWRLYLRDRGALFWTFAFPILMLLAFGVIFRGGTQPATTLVWVQERGGALGDEALAQELSRVTPPLQVRRPSASEAQAAWSAGRTAVQLVTSPEGRQLRVNTYLLSQGQSGAQAVQQAALLAQVKGEGRSPDLVEAVLESPGGRRPASYAAFLLPGLLGLNLLSMGLFSVGMVNVSYREKGKFRRLAVTPLPKWVFLLGQVANRLLIAFLASTLLLVVGRLAFGITCQGSLLELGLVLALGAGTFMSMGFALSGFASTSETYGAISNVFFLPMMLLSGIYFTLDSAPQWIQKAMVMLPLSPFVHALRGIFNDGASLGSHLGGLALVGLWGMLAFGIALRKFKWV